MLCTYFLEYGIEWDQGIPLLLFAVRKNVQESLGFSPAGLLFGHTVRGPLKQWCEELMEDSPLQLNVLDYVSSFRERLHHACTLAKKALAASQSRIKLHFDQTAVQRCFQPGDLLLDLLPIQGSVL